MDQAKHARTPMITNEKLDLDKDGNLLVRSSIKA